MTWTRWLIAVTVGLTLAADASAQFFPVFGMPVILQNGIDIRYNSKRLSIDAFFPSGPPFTGIVPVTPTPFGFKQVGPVFVPSGYGYPYGYGYGLVAPGYPFPGYGSIDQRITVQIINPPAVGPARLNLRSDEAYDLSGIDLDVESPTKIWGEKKPALAKGIGKKVDLARFEPDDRKLKVAADREKVEPPPRKVERMPEGERLTELGVLAFKNGEYGLALMRFEQATEAEPPGERAGFYQGQAYVAIGKYREAAEVFRQALTKQPDWPSSRFRARRDLYDGDDAVFMSHRKRLEDAHTLHPKDGDVLFLLGYVSWFDAQRGVANDYFTQARPHFGNPMWVDLFLKGAAAKK